MRNHGDEMSDVGLLMIPVKQKFRMTWHLSIYFRRRPTHVLSEKMETQGVGEIIPWSARCRKISAFKL